MGSRQPGTPRLSALIEPSESERVPWLRSEAAALLESLHFLLGRRPGRAARGADSCKEQRSEALTRALLMTACNLCCSGSAEGGRAALFSKADVPTAQGAFPRDAPKLQHWLLHLSH